MEVLRYNLLQNIEIEILEGEQNIESLRIFVHTYFQLQAFSRFYLLSVHVAL